MTTVKAFDEMMGQFLGELARAFPDEPPKTAVNCSTFMKQVAPWAGQVSSHDESFFCEQNEFAKNLNLHVIWKREDCSENTKQAIWQYLSSLYMISTTMSMFPPETLSAIEAAAENCAKNMKLGPNGQPDEASLMAGVNSMLSQMMRSGSGNPFASLLGGGGGGGALQPPPPRLDGPQKKKKSRK
jgi:hypothetical protein